MLKQLRELEGRLKSAAETDRSKIRDQISIVFERMNILDLLEKVVLNHADGSGGCENPDVPMTCRHSKGEPLCRWCALDEALERAGLKEDVETYSKVHAFNRRQRNWIDYHLSGTCWCPTADACRDTVRKLEESLETGPSKA